MAKKKSGSAIVYSTDPGFKISEETELNQNVAASEQQPLVFLETKHRAGKAVTVIQRIEAAEGDLEAISRKLKVLCGTGGSAKDGEIIIQGDHRDKILQWLQKAGYTRAKKK